MKTVSTTDAKATMNALVAEVSAGQTVTITHRGRPAAILSPVAPEQRRFGTFAGVVSRTEEFDAPMSEEELAEWGEAG